MSNIRNYGNSIRQNFLGAVNNISAISRERQSIDAANMILEAKAEYDSKMSYYRQNPSEYQNMAEDFNSLADDLRKNAETNLSGPYAQKMFTQQFNNLAAQYNVHQQNLYDNQFVADTKLQGQRNLDNQVENVKWDTEGYATSIAAARVTIQGSSVYTDAEKAALMDETENRMLYQAVKAGYTDAFNSFDGSYAEKAQAAEAFIHSQSLGNLDAKTTEAFYSDIRSMENAEYTRNVRYESEQDDAKFQDFNSLYMAAKQSGDWTAAKEYCYNVDTYNEALPSNWLGMCEREEAAMLSGGGSGSGTLTPEIQKALLGIARDTTKDETYKHDYALDIMLDMGMDPNYFDDGIRYMNTFVENYQNPVFKEGVDTLTSFYEKMIKDKDKFDGVEGEELQKLFDHRLQQLDHIYRSGEYEASQIPQIVDNFMSETRKEAIAIELETTAKVATLEALHPENLAGIKDFPTMMEKAERGEFQGVRPEYQEDLQLFEKGYDSAMDKVIQDNGIPGLEKMTGMYINDGKPMYKATVDGKDYVIKMMADGTFKYFVQYKAGSSDGEWKDLDYNYNSPEEQAAAEEAERQANWEATGDDKYRKGATNEEMGAELEGALAPGLEAVKDNPVIKSITGTPRSLTPNGGGPALAPPAPAVLEPLEQEIRDFFDKGDLNFMGNIRNADVSDMMRRYRKDYKEMNQIIRSIRAEMGE